MELIPGFGNARLRRAGLLWEYRMQFDPALAARAALKDAQTELGADWATAAELEEAFSSNAGHTAAEAFEGLLHLAERHPDARAFQAFCIYITWQHVTEETVRRHFETGLRLCERYLGSPDRNMDPHLGQVKELSESFRAGLGLDEEDEMQVEFRQDTPKGGD
jgi:hypothetical protein